MSIRRMTLLGCFAALTSLACGQDASESVETARAGLATPFTTPAAVWTALEGKTFVMRGDDIPSHPNGYSEDVNYGAATQCYQQVSVSTAGGVISVQSDQATLVGTAKVGDAGVCEHAAKASSLAYASTTALIENASPTGECFDITIAFPAVTQEGRGFLSPDGQVVTLELFFAKQATGHRCANGKVGDPTVQLNGAPFTGNAVQVFRLVP